MDATTYEAQTIGQSYAPCIGLDDCPPATFRPTARTERREHTRTREPGNRRIRRVCRDADAAVGVPLTAPTLRVFVSRHFGRSGVCPAPWRMTREIRAHIVARDGEPQPMASEPQPQPEGEPMPEGWAEALAAADVADALGFDGLPADIG